MFSKYWCKSGHLNYDKHEKFSDENLSNDHTNKPDGRITIKKIDQEVMKTRHQVTASVDNSI